MVDVVISTTMEHFIQFDKALRHLEQNLQQAGFSGYAYNGWLPYPLEYVGGILCFSVWW
jgi:hypothetical protein